jgi:hypothetical protein
MLLGDLREMFDRAPSGVLFGREVAAELAKREDRPWPEYGRDHKPITPVQIAALLKPFEIPTNKTVRRDDETAKGYRCEECEDAFARYLPRKQSHSHNPASPRLSAKSVQSHQRRL